MTLNGHSLAPAEESPPTVKGNCCYGRWGNPLLWLKKRTTMHRDENGEACCEAGELTQRLCCMDLVKRRNPASASALRTLSRMLRQSAHGNVEIDKRWLTPSLPNLYLTQNGRQNTNAQFARRIS